MATRGEVCGQNRSGRTAGDQLAVLAGSRGSISSQQGGSLQWMCWGEGRRLPLRVIGTTQLDNRVDQMWPLGRGVVGVLVALAVALA
jgi:hypothetical protein